MWRNDFTNKQFEKDLAQEYPKDSNTHALEKSYKTSYILIIDIKWGHED